MKYLAILRGINVSGQKKIRMADLKALFESINFQDVETYIQSGNVVFESNSKQISQLKLKIENSIEKSYNFYVPVEIRTKDDMKYIVDNCPFNPVDMESDGTKVLVTFLSDQPSPENTLKIMEFVVPPEKLMIIEKEVYLYCPDGYGKTKLSNTFLEKKLGVVATTRNWKSICKFYELLNHRPCV